MKVLRVKKYARIKRTALQNEELSFINFITNAIDNSPFKEDLHWHIHNFNKRPLEQKRKLFPGFYLFVERYIFNSIQTSQESFREVLYEQFGFAIDRNPELKLIFTKGEEQILSLYNIFLNKVLDEAEQKFIVGTPWIYKWQPQLMQPELEKDQLIEMAHDIYRDFCKYEGEKDALKAFNDVYDHLHLRYQSLNTFSEVLKLFPSRALDEIKYNLLSLQQMKSLLSDKVNNLERLSQELKEKNKELENQYEELATQSDQLNFQNQKLSYAQHLIDFMVEELNLHNRRLEDKVKERTQELENSNKLLTKYNENLEQYTFAISHQLKAPVARIVGLTNLVRIIPEAERPVVMESIHGSAKELEGIFKDLVHALNLKSAAADVKKEKVNVKEVLEDIWSSRVASNNNSSLVAECNIEGEAIIETDKEVLTEAISHIFDNTLKFAKAASGAKVQAKIFEDEGRLNIHIEDDGIGFNADEVQSKLFTAFGRFNLTHNGRGMGLYLSKHHVSVLGGDIKLESVLDRGTKVQVAIPV